MSKPDVGVFPEASDEVTDMDPKTVEKLEAKIEEAITEVVLKMGRKKLPLLPARHTFQMMAKAAVAVYEAVAEDERQAKESP